MVNKNTIKLDNTLMDIGWFTFMRFKIYGRAIINKSIPPYAKEYLRTILEQEVLALNSLTALVRRSLIVTTEDCSDLTSFWKSRLSKWIGAEISEYF